MYEAIIWDKESSINGVEAATVLASRQNLGSDEMVFLVYDSALPSCILRIEHMNVIRSNSGYGSDLSDSDVIAAYLEEANAPAVVVEEAVATDNELAIMDALTTIYEQNLEILNQ